MGGYANELRLVHQLQADPEGRLPKEGAKAEASLDPGLDLTLESYDTTNPGFLEITVTEEKLTIENFAVPFDGGAVKQNDHVVISLGHNIS